MSEVVLREPLPLVWVGSRNRVPGKPWPRAGFAYFAPKRGGWDTGGDRLSPGYLQHVARVRRPIVVMCPLRYGRTKADGEIVDPDVLLGSPFCIDNLSTAKREPWDVTVDLGSLVIGQKPDITVHPSIHMIGIWHGWLEHGVLHQ